MGPEPLPLKCVCGQTFPAPTDPAVKPACPACRKPYDAPPETPEESVGLDKILIDKGFVTPDQVKTALARQQEDAAQGKQVRLGETLVALGFAKPEQIREALALQGKTPMRCPTCKKTFNVKSPKPGTRLMCKTCRVPLMTPGSITDLHAEDTGTGLQPTLMGEPADPAIKDLISGYLIERKIASGGMGEVFLARQQALDRAVAVKLLSQDLAKDVTYVQRFLAEARAAGKLSHENIVGAVDAGEAKGRYYFVMEYVQGETLFQIVYRDGVLSERRALEITRQIARGLRHAHQQGLIHRDIKSANIMIGLDGTAKICDFGLAREIKVDVKLTQPGVVHSSPSYSSPEQCRAQKLDHRSDMYSLGVTLFEMLTRRVPFESDVPSALFVSHATQPPPSPRSINAAISPAVNQFILRLLKKNPEGRFKDYDELLAAIEQLERAPATPAPSSHKPPITSVPPKAPARGSGAKWAGAAVAALLLVVILMVVMKKGGPGDGQAPQASSSADKGADRLLKEARAFEQKNSGTPSGYPAVRARWKGLVEQFRGTPHHNQFAGPLLEFEAKVSQEAESAAQALSEQARSRIDAGKVAVALGLLRSYPAGYESTPGAAQIAGLVAQLEKTLDGRLAEGKEHCWSLILSEKFDDARKAIEDLRASLGYADEKGPQYARQSYREELDGLERKLQEELVFARKRAAEAAAKANPTPVLQPPPDPVVKPVPRPDPTPVVKPPPPPKGEEPIRRAPPIGAELKQAEELVRDLFKAEYAKKTPGAKYDLARKMIDLARQTNDDPTGRFVLLREARDLAASAGEAELAYRAIDEIVREYVVNPASMKSVVLSELSLTARTPDELKSTATAFLLLADEALEAEDYAGADRAAGNAVQMARRAKDIPLVAKAGAKAKEVADLKARFERTASAREALKKNPDDPAANLALGEYLCLSKGNWDVGLQHLAKGSDAALKALALKDLARPSEVADLVGLADGWWDHGDKAADSKDALRKRAAVWYDAAIPQLSGIHKTRAQKRVQEAGLTPGEGAAALPPPVSDLDLLGRIDPGADSIHGTWKLVAGKLHSPALLEPRFASCAVPYSPPAEYDLSLTAERRSGSSSLAVGLVAGGKQFDLELDGYDGSAGRSFSGLDRIDGLWPPRGDAAFRGAIFADKAPHTFVVRVRKTTVSVLLDGKPVMNWAADYGRFSGPHPAITVKSPDTLFLAAWQSEYVIHRLTIKPVSGQGRLVR